MKQENGILYLGRDDLILESKEKDVKDISMYDIKGSITPFAKAEMVFFIDGAFMKIMKCRYVIVQ